MPEFTIGIDTDTALDTITEDLVSKYAIGAVDDSAAAMNKYELASAAGSNGISSLFAAAYPVLETMLHGNVLEQHWIISEETGSCTKNESDDPSFAILAQQKQKRHGTCLQQAYNEQLNDRLLQPASGPYRWPTCSQSKSSLNTLSAYAAL